MYNSFVSFIIALMLTKNSADARNCYCLASYPSKTIVDHYACLPKVKVCALCQSHVLFIEVKK